MEHQKLSKLPFDLLESALGGVAYRSVSRENWRKFFHQGESFSTNKVRVICVDAFAFQLASALGEGYLTNSFPQAVPNCWCLTSVDRVNNCTCIATYIGDGDLARLLYIGLHRLKITMHVRKSASKGIGVLVWTLKSVSKNVSFLVDTEFLWKFVW